MRTVRESKRAGTERPFLILALISAGLAGGCATAGSQLDAPTDPASKTETAGPIEPSDAAGPVAADPGAEAESSEAASSAEGPVIYRLGDPTDVFPPAPPEGLTGIAVPVIVTEPVVEVRSGPQSALAEKLVEAPPGKPKLRNGPPRGRYPGGPSELASVASVAGRSGLQGEPPPAPAAPAAATTFDSLDFDDTGANTGGFYFNPADPSGAAGPDHVVSVNNVSIQFHTKAGTELLDSVPGAPLTGISLASFFTPVAPVNFLFDPKVIYDQHADRFVVVALERQDDCPLIGDATDDSRILVAVSDDADPTGSWFFAAIASKLSISSTDTWADYPGLAVDEEAVYLAMNMFTYGSGGSCLSSFVDDRLWVIDKFTGAGGGFYGGGTATVSLFDSSPASFFTFNIHPAHVFGLPPTSPNVGTWLVSYNALTSGGPGGIEFIQVGRLDDPIGPGTPTIFGPFFASLGDIEDVGGAFGFPFLPDAPQSGSAVAIETNDRRTLHAVWRGGDLYVTTTIDPKAGDPSSGEATAHWAQIDTTTLGSPTTLDNGSIGGEDIAADTHTFFPSIAVNDSADVAIGFSASGGLIFPGSYYTTRKAGDPPGSNSGSAVLKAGLDDFVRTFGGAANRWGDYSGLSIDPFDECFWVYNKHAITNGTMFGGEDGRWGTAFAYFCESCPTNLVIPSGTSISGTDSEEARDSLTSSTLTVESTGDYTVTTEKYEAENGLEVESGGEFTVVSGPC